MQGLFYGTAPVFVIIQNTRIVFFILIETKLNMIRINM